MTPTSPLTSPPTGTAGPTDPAGGKVFGARQRLLALLVAVALVATIAVVAVLIVGRQGANLTGPQTGPQSGSGTTNASPASTPAPSPPATASTPPSTIGSATASTSSSPGPSSAGDSIAWTRSETARQLWLPAALGFAEHYTLASKPASVAAWAAALAPYSTAKVTEYLATRRLDQIPTDAAYDGTVEVLQYGTAQNPDQVAVQITYDDGYQLVLYISLTQQPAIGRVAAFDEIES